MHNGRREGVFTTWHDNGKKSKGGTYKNGKKEGVWTVWRYGKKSEEKYKGGKRID